MIKKFLLTAAILIGGLLFLESALEVDHQCRFDEFEDYWAYHEANTSIYQGNFSYLELRQNAYSHYYRKCRNGVENAS